MKKKIISALLGLIISGVILFLLVSAVFFVFRKEFDIGLYNEDIFWQVFASAFLIGGAIVVYRMLNTWESRRILKVNDNLEESRWLNIDDVKKNDNLTITTFKKLTTKKTGIPIYAKAYSKKDLHIILAQPSHVLIIGTTGSGKTSGFLEPEIEILSRLGEKPSMIISDPKGELYSHRATSLMACGYDIKKINLSEPYSSARWNVFSLIIELCDEIKNCTIENEIERRIFIQERQDRIFEDLRDVVDTMCPIESKNEPSWEKTSRDFILACVLVMKEEYINGRISKEQFCLYNLYKTVLQYTTSDVDKMKEYFLNHKTSQIKSLASPVVVAEGKTLTSYLSEIAKHISWLSDMGISALTSETEISLSEFDEKPTALFIIVPDEKESRNKLVSLFVTQAYKGLISKAKKNHAEGKTNGQELLRNTYFLLDEFGNLPEFPTIDKIITVGRSRKVFLQAVIQDYAQLENKYGKTKANIIKSNSNVKIFIGSNDSATLKEWSELCGKVKVRNYSYGGRAQDNAHVNVSATERPLIHASDLQRLNDPPKVMGNAIILAFGKYPLKAVFTPIFKTPAYNNGSTAIKVEEETKRFFDVEEYEKDFFFCATKTQALTERTLEVNQEKKGKQETVQEHFENKRIIYTQIDEQLAKYEKSISEADFLYLRQATFEQKIERLRDLSARAVAEGKRVLGLDLNKTATLLEARFSEKLKEIDR